MQLLETVEDLVKGQIEKNGEAFIDAQFDKLLAKTSNPIVKFFVASLREQAKADLKEFALKLADKIDGQVG